VQAWCQPEPAALARALLNCPERPASTILAATKGAAFTNEEARVSADDSVISIDMTKEYSRAARSSEGRRTASSKRRNVTACQDVLHTLRSENIDLDGLRHRAKCRAATRHAKSVKGRPKEDLLAAPRMTPPG